MNRNLPTTVFTFDSEWDLPIASNCVFRTRERLMEVLRENITVVEEYTLDEALEHGLINIYELEVL